MFLYSTISTTLFYAYILPGIKTNAQKDHWIRIIKLDYNSLRLQSDYLRMQKIDFRVYENFLERSMEQDSEYLRCLERLSI